jgi:hypothetical protein
MTAGIIALLIVSNVAVSVLLVYYVRRSRRLERALKREMLFA